MLCFLLRKRNETKIFETVKVGIRLSSYNDTSELPYTLDKHVQIAILQPQIFFINDL